MRLPRFLLLALAPSSLLALVATSANASEPSLEDMIAAAPKLASSDPKCPSFEVGGFLTAEKGEVLKFRAIYRAPGRSAVLLSDGSNDAPLIFVAGREGFVYDPVRPIALYADRSRLDLTLGQGKDNLGFRLGWQFGGGNQSSRIDVDLKSLFAAPSRAMEAVKMGDGTYRLTKTTPEENRLVCRIDPRLTQPYTRLEVYDKGKDKPSLCIDKIVIAPDLSDEDFAFPERTALAEKIPVKDLSEAGLWKTVSGVAVALRAVHARIEAHHRPEPPHAIRLLRFSGHRRNDVIENDLKYAQPMRDLLPSRFKMP